MLVQFGVRRMRQLPDVPTAIEQGLTNFDSRGLFGLLAPAGTPNDVIQLLNREIGAVLRDPAVRDKLIQQGIEPDPGTSEGLRDLINSEIIKWARVIKEADIKPE